MSYQDVLRRMFEELQAGYAGERQAQKQREAMYGKQRAIPQEEQKNALALAGAGQMIYNPHAAANQGIDLSNVATQTAGLPKPKVGDFFQYDPRLDQSPYDPGTTTHDKVYDPKQFAITEWARKNEGRSVPRSKLYSGQAGRLQYALLQRGVDEWSAIRAQLNKDYEKFDGIAKSQISELENQTESLDEAYGRGDLDPVQYMEEIGRINRVAQGYKWDMHERAPGSQVGDVVVDNGVLKIRTQNGFDLKDYTPEYREENTRAIRDDEGNVLSYIVPTIPGQKPLQISPQEKKLMEKGYDEKEIKDIRDQFNRNLNAIRNQRLIGDVTPEQEIDEIKQARRLTFSAEKGLRGILDGLTDGDLPDWDAGASAMDEEYLRDKAGVDQQIDEANAVTGAKQWMVSNDVAKLLSGAKTQQQRAEITADNWQHIEYVKNQAANPIPWKPGQKATSGTVVVDPLGRKFLVSGGRFYFLEPEEQPDAFAAGAF